MAELVNMLEGRKTWEAAEYMRTACNLSVCPLKPKDKIPPEGFSWKEYQTTPPSLEKLAEWEEEYPDANYAIPLGEPFDIVVADCDDEEALKWAEKTFVHTPWRVKTGKGWHLYYRYPKGIKVRSENLRSSKGIACEIKSDGVYVVGPQSIHANGNIYTLQTEGPIEWDWVPEFGYIEDLKKNVEIDPKINLKDVEAIFAEIPFGERNNSLARYCGRLYAAGLTVEQVKEKAKQKNIDCCNPPLKPREVMSVVGSIYRTHQRNHPDGTPAPKDGGASVNLTDYSGVRLVDVISEEDSINIWPEELLHPGGLLEEIMDYTAKSNRYSHPIYNLAGAIAVLSTISGRKVKTQSKLTTNIYCTVLGKSGSGKDAPKKTTEKLLYLVNRSLYGGNDVASAAAIFTALEHDHRCCFIFDEFGLMLKACKNQNSPKTELVKVTTELFSFYDSPYKKPYKKREDAVEIPWQNLCILGLSVPDEFWAAMQDGESTNGAMARHLLFEHVGKKMPANRNIFRGTPWGLIGKLKKIYQIDCNDIVVPLSETTDENGYYKPQEKEFVEETDGDTPYITDSKNVCLDQMVYPYTVFFTEEAEEFHEEKAALYDNLTEKANGKHAAAKEALYSRFAEHAWKLALLKAVSRLGSSIVEEADRFRNATKHHIEIEDIKWGWLLVETTGNQFINKLETALYSSQFEQWCNDALKAIRTYIRREFKRNGNKKPGAPRREIERALHIPSKSVQDVIDKLANMNTIKLIEGWKCSEKSKKPMNLYCIVEDIEDK